MRSPPMRMAASSSGRPATRRELNLTRSAGPPPRVCNRSAEFLSAGPDHLTGWQLQGAFTVSADGTVISGYGINPSGNDQAFVARIPMNAFAFLDLAWGRSRARLAVVGWRRHQ